MIGSRTIRTEEAILISLAALADKLEPQHGPKDFDLAHSIPQSTDTGVKYIADNSSKRKHKRKLNNQQNSMSNESNDGNNESAVNEST